MANMSKKRKCNYDSFSSQKNCRLIPCDRISCFNCTRSLRKTQHFKCITCKVRICSLCHTSAVKKGSNSKKHKVRMIKLKVKEVVSDDEDPKAIKQREEKFKKHVHWKTFKETWWPNRAAYLKNGKLREYAKQSESTEFLGLSMEAAWWNVARCRIEKRETPCEQSNEDLVMEYVTKLESGEIFMELEEGDNPTGGDDEDENLADEPPREKKCLKMRDRIRKSLF